MRLMIDLEVTNDQGNNYVNDRFEKAKNNPIVPIMLMINLRKLKTTQYYN